MKVDNVITGVTVSWNSIELVKRSIESLRKFHPVMKIIIVDGSPKDSDCKQFVKELPDIDENITALLVDRNIGHGLGMNLAVGYVETPFALFFDTDIVVVKSPLQGMLDMMEDDTFGVGYSEIVAPDGHDYGVLPRHKINHPPKVKYLHPYFQLVQLKEYKKYKPYIHHGAPCISAMWDIHQKGLSDKVLKEFPGLGHTKGRGTSWVPCAGEWVLHDVEHFGGTGRLRQAMGLPHIEGEWDNSYV
jgi:GT2 family glycosyltransferase